MVLQVQISDGLLNDRLDLMSSDALDKSVELDCLLYRHLWEDSVVLWAVSYQLPGLLEIFLDVIAFNCYLSSSRGRVPRQTLERS